MRAAFSGVFANVSKARRGICLADSAGVSRKARINARGVTRFELTAVAAMAAVLAVGCLLVVKPRIAAAETTEAVKDAGRILSAVQEWRRENGKGCPTLSQLVEEKQLSQSARMDDPWGERYRVRCTDDEVTVVSPGQDHQPNTSDDIRVPRSNG
jgi:general secretion pathway protein G